MRMPRITRKRIAVLFAIIIVTMGGLSTLDQDSLIRLISRLTERVNKLERIFSGVPIGTVRIADAAITSAKIGNLDADKITTGILTLKDGDERAKLRVLNSADEEIIAVDLNGFQVKNTGGDVIALLNEDGLEINGGNIVVRNSDDEVVFDVNGLVSTSNFSVESNFATSGDTISSSNTWEDMDNMSVSFDLVKDTRILIMFTGRISPASWSDGKQLDIHLAIDIDGTKHPNSTSGYGDLIHLKDESSVGGYDLYYYPTTLHYVVTLGAGSHTIKMQWMRNSTSNTNGIALDRILTALVLGR